MVMAPMKTHFLEAHHTTPPNSPPFSGISSVLHIVLLPRFSFSSTQVSPLSSFLPVWAKVLPELRAFSSLPRFYLLMTSSYLRLVACLRLSVLALPRHHPLFYINASSFPKHYLIDVDALVGLLLSSIVQRRARS